MLPEEQEKIYEEIIQFERMEFVSPPMRELILDVWLELAHKLPPEDAAPPDERAWYWSFHDSVDRPSDVRANGHAPTLEAAKGELATCWHKWLAWAELSETI
jgi:hypothetical protein